MRPNKTPVIVWLNGDSLFINIAVNNKIKAKISDMPNIKILFIAFELIKIKNNKLGSFKLPLK